MSVYGTNGVEGIFSTSSEMPVELQGRKVPLAAQNVKVGVPLLVLMKAKDSELYSATTSRLLADGKPPPAVPWLSMTKPLMAQVGNCVGGGHTTGPKMENMSLQSMKKAPSGSRNVEAKAI